MQTFDDLKHRLRVELAWPRRLLKVAAVLAALWMAMTLAEGLWRLLH